MNEKRWRYVVTVGDHIGEHSVVVALTEHQALTIGALETIIDESNTCDAYIHIDLDGRIKI